MTKTQHERLSEIKEEIKALTDEAYRIVRNADTVEGERARPYWRGSILGALDDDEYVPSMFTLQDAIDRLQPEDDDGDDEQESLTTEGATSA
jgi:hypothetical protein